MYQLDPSLTPSLMRVGLNEITTFRWSLPRDVELCNDFGIQNLGIWWPKLIRFGEEKGIELLRDSGLRVSSLSYAGGFTGSFGLRFKDAIDETKYALSLAGQLRAGCVTLLSGSKEKYTTKHAARLLRSGIKKVLDHAEECDVAIALKPTHPAIQQEWSFLNSIDAALEEIAFFDSPYLKLVIDVSQIRDVPGFLHRAKGIAPHIALVKVSDARYPLACQYERQQLGDGAVPLRDIVQSLETAGYAGNYEISLWSRLLWQLDYVDLVHESITRFDSICRQ